MNSGPTGSLMVAARMRSISAIAGASSHHPFTSSTGCSWAGWRAPGSPLLEALVGLRADGAQTRRHIDRELAREAAIERTRAELDESKERAHVAGRRKSTK
jgi:hypothetical protein